MPERSTRHAKTQTSAFLSFTSTWAAFGPIVSTPRLTTAPSDNASVTNTAIRTTTIPSTTRKIHFRFIESPRDESTIAPPVFRSHYIPFGESTSFDLPRSLAGLYENTRERTSPGIGVVRLWRWSERSAYFTAGLLAARGNHRLRAPWRKTTGRP